MAKSKKSKNGSKKEKQDKLASAIAASILMMTELKNEIDEKVDASVKELFTLLTAGASQEDNELSQTAKELAAYWHTALVRWSEETIVEEGISKEENLA